MRPFLNDFIDTLSGRQQARVAYLLEEAKLSKEEVPLIAERLIEMEEFIPLFMTTEREEDLIRNTGFFVNLRDAQARLREVYDVSNLVSLLLDSHQSILKSEVKALEDELIALDKEARNYSFLLADNGAFDYAYLEPFSDELGRDALATSPDRTALSFGPIEGASVNSAEGVLVLPQNLSTSYALNATIADGNITSMLDNQNVSVITASNTQGWRASLDVAAPITSGLPIAEGHTGAQVVLEFRLPESSPCSEIKVSPFADAVQELVQVIVYPGDDETGMEKLMVSSVELDRPYTLHFPMRSVKRFKLVINQPVYNRISQFSTTEDAYRAMYEQTQRKLDDINDRFNVHQEPTFTRLKLMAQRLMGKRGHDRFVMLVSQALVGRIPMWGPGHPHFIRDWVNSPWRRHKNRYNTHTEAERTLLELFHRHSAVFSDLTRREVEEFNSWLSKKGLYDPEGVITTPLARIYNQDFKYRYIFGVHSVGIGVESVGYKGFWVSNPFSSDGDFGEVRIKVDEDNYRSTNTDMNNSLLTSAEYSITNRSSPSSEDDWIPIMPVGQEIVESERSFPDDTGRCLFRFVADGTAQTSVFKNGYALSILPETDLLYDDYRQGVIGIRLPVNGYTTEDIITVRYTPVRDFTVVNFEAEGFAEAPLVTAYDEDGAGEGFVTTVGRNEVSLTHIPYLDTAAVTAAEYDDDFGLTAYQPITVRLADGTTAINLTNYKGGDQTALPLDGYYYHHSGKTLIFNRPLESSFRVYYQYLKNNVRVRVVLRCNSRDFVSPKVNFYHLKAKTRRPIKEILS